MNEKNDDDTTPASGPGPSPQGSPTSAPPPPPSYGAPPPGSHGPHGPQPGSAGQATGDRLLQDLRALRRSRDDRVIAGVCGGVARQLGIDPLLVRVVTAVLAIFGAGVVLYAVAWLLLPTDDGTPSVGEQAVSRGGSQSSTSTVLLALALAVVATLGLGAAFSRWDGPFLFFLALGGLIAWIVLRDRRGEPAPGVSLGKGTGPTGPTGPIGPTGPAATSPLPTYQPHAPGYPAGPAYPPPAGPPAGPYGSAPQPVTPPPPPAPRRPHSALFSVTMSLVLVGLGSLKLVELSGADVVPAAYPALALTIVGLGLLVGTWLGRSRGLIVVGLLAALLTAGVSAGDAWDEHGRNHVDVRNTPMSLAELPTSFDFGTGSVQYDLTRLDFTGSHRTMDVSVGAGEIIVIVPPDVDVTANASLGIGEIELFGQQRGGFPSDVTATDLGADGAGGGELTLTLDGGVGHLEVRRG